MLPLKKMPKTNNALWFIQGALAGAFLFHGIAALLSPVAVQEAWARIPYSPQFMNVVSVLEILGAIGLILPAATRIFPRLTPLAATCLGIVMFGATLYQLYYGDYGAWKTPATLALLSAIVAIGRFRFVRIPARVCLQGA